MKKPVLFLLISTVPLLLFAGIWQIYSYQNLVKEVRLMEAEQKRWFEENKRKVVGIEYLGSPRRLDQVAREELHLEKVDAGDIIRIQIVPSEEEQNE